MMACVVGHDLADMVASGQASQTDTFVALRPSALLQPGDPDEP